MKHETDGFGTLVPADVQHLYQAGALANVYRACEHGALLAQVSPRIQVPYFGKHS